MDYGQRQRLIARVSWGKELYEDTVLRPPTDEERARASVAYEDALMEAWTLGMLSEQEALDGHGWTPQDDAVIDGLRADIKALKRGMLDLLYQTDKLAKVRGHVRRAERVLMERLTSRQGLLAESAESFATGREQQYIISVIAEHPNGTPLWPTQEAFDEFHDPRMVDDLIRWHFSGSRLGESVIRELARTEPWRSLWYACRSVCNPFTLSPMCWSANQVALVSWSQAYDVVFESIDRPARQVIEDDDLLDSWFIRQEDQIEARVRQHEGDALANPRFTGKGRQEVFVVADAEGARRLYELNTPDARRRIHHRQDLVARSGRVREQDMPDSRMEMRQQAMQQDSARLKDISRR